MTTPSCQTVHSPRSGFGRSWSDATAVLVAGTARTIGALLVWQSRATERHHLASLDDRLLKDMGLSRADVENEAAKPFWKA